MSSQKTITQKKNLQKGGESQNQAVLLIFVGYALVPLLRYSLEEFW